MRNIRDKIFQFFEFDILFRFSAAIVFIPLLLKGLAISADRVNVMFISGKNIFLYLKDPIVLSLIFLSSVVLICLAYFEMCCIISVAQQHKDKKISHSADMFIRGYALMKKTARKTGPKLMLWMFAVFPAWNISALIIMINKIAIFENILKTLTKGKVIIPVLLAVIIIPKIISAILIPCFRKNFFGQNNDNCFKEFIVNFFKIILADLIIAVFITLIYFILIFISAVIMRFLLNQNMFFSHFMKAENIIYYFLALVSGALGTAANIFIITSFPHSSTEDFNENFSSKKVKLKKIFVTVIVFITTIADISLVGEYIMNGSHVIEDIFISTSVTAHRGGAKFVPENTMYAVRYAIESSADYIEIDVQLSADKKIFLLHDDSLKRTTGVNKNAYTMKYEDIASLDAGSWFDSKFSDAYIPELDEVLSECKGKINLNIELKKSGNSGNELADKLIELIYKYDMQEQCVITSVNYQYLKYIKMKAPEIRTGYIANVFFGNVQSFEYADFFSVKYVVVNDKFVKSAHDAGKEVHVWTVNSRSMINKMKSFDVDSIITDDPVLCRKVLSSKSKRRSFAEIFQEFLFKNR